MHLNLHSVVLILCTLSGIACADVGLDAYEVETEGALLDIDPLGDVSFGNVNAIDGNSVEDVLLWASGDNTVPVIDVYLDDYSSEAFEIRGDLPLPMLMDSGSEFPVVVAFEPYAVGQFSGSLVIEIDVDGEVVPLERRLVGQGCDPDNASGNCH